MRNSSSTNHACSEHEYFGQYDQYEIPSLGNAMLHVSCKFGERKWNPYGVTVLTSSSVANWVLHKHYEYQKYGPYAIPFEVMLRYRCLEVCEITPLALIMTWTCLVSMRILTNMVHVQKQSERMLCPHSTSSVGIKSSHLCTLASKLSSLTDSTQRFWLVKYFPSDLWTIFYMNTLSILLGCQCCEKWSQIIHINLTKTSSISHYTNSNHIPNFISKQIFQIKALKYIVPFIIQWILLLMVSHDGP